MTTNKYIPIAMRMWQAIVESMFTLVLRPYLGGPGEQETGQQ